MHCCVCSGVCYHVGGPYYCSAHNPKSVSQDTWNFKVTYPYPTQLYICPVDQHCYCRKLVDGHVECCNCNHRTKEGLSDPL